ncbi:MAG: hypothetical protein CFE23_01590 [Flavobacterium sp. BFFFF1]|uniref:hypothetical protein n=1 Tax=Flavobacterium sp. BFFFF1 TaxID=2015557 RepID=UPI000BCDD3CC|nr:hypothetical protein [Flavobacterium sp. BFFFF1]OYU82019.1 MAG: hypothetical protein CFE23_01590 [Flavobacterium sp. BFFFF1]
MKQKLFFLTLLLLSVLATSCNSWQVMPREYRHVKIKSEREKAYVVNKDSLKKQYKILRKSEIFELTDDATTPLKITLAQPSIGRLGPSCGTGAVTALFVTLGQLPIHMEDGEVFSFEENRDGKITTREFRIELRQTMWFWNMFLFDQNRNKKLARGLRGHYYAQQQ